MLTRNQIRQEMRQKRLVLSADIHQNLSTKICQKIQELDIYQRAKKVGLYYAIEHEVDLNQLLLDDKQFFLPKMRPDWHLDFYAYCLQDDLTKNGTIYEPKTSLRIAIQELDLLLIPILAFDAKAFRLGSGKACYDRTLVEEQPKITIGVAFAFQEVPSIHPEEHDVPMQNIITEYGLSLTSSAHDIHD